MIDFMRSWIVNIVIMIIFITFLEIILPSSNMKRYIQMIIGLLIIIVLINPFINLITKDINIEREVFANIGKSFSYNQNDSNEYIKVKNEQITSMYKQKLYKDINELIVKEDTYYILNIEIDIIDDSTQENYGDISRIEVALSNSKKENSQKQGEIKIINIEKIIVSASDDILNRNFQISEDCKEMQKIISESYKIPEDKVLVYLETESK